MMSPLFGTSMRPDSAQKSGGLPRSLTAGVRWFLPRGPSGGPSRVGSPVGGFATAKLEPANIAMTEIVSAAERRRETPPRYAPRVAYNILTPSPAADPVTHAALAGWAVTATYADGLNTAPLPSAVRS